ncbi:MAG: TolC family protein, partial [Acetobacteraceae bacterium]|nr:TolC family protein [Acetobacteraceae bacterium]
MANFKMLWWTALLCASVCGAQTTAEGPDRTLELNLQKAIQLALSKNGNTTVRLAQESVSVSHWRYAEARSGLLPNFDGSVVEQEQLVNLHALGVRFSAPGGFTTPKEVGPFNTFDARLHFTQNLLNFSTIRHSQAAHAEVHASEADSRSTDQQVAASVARLYAAALRAEADVSNAQANVALAQ